ncbi:hypothetical protein GCM10009847_02390 [Leucobacter tardus]
MSPKGPRTWRVRAIDTALARASRKETSSLMAESHRRVELAADGETAVVLLSSAMVTL